MTLPTNTLHTIRLKGQGDVRYYFFKGKGPVVILLHGGGLDTSSTSWEKTIQSLQGRYTIYAPDWPKQGKSKPFRGKTSQQQLENVLSQLIDAWKVKEVILVGFSMGGSIAIGYTLNHKQSVKKLVLVDSGGLQRRANLHALGYVIFKFPFAQRLLDLLTKSRVVIRWGLEHVFLRHKPRDFEKMVREIHAESIDQGRTHSDWQIDQILWSKFKTNYMPRLQEITCPTLIIHAREDKIVPLSVAKKAANRLPKGELRIIQNSSHWPNREHPNVFNSALRQFLDKN